MACVDAQPAGTQCRTCSAILRSKKWPLSFGSSLPTVGPSRGCGARVAPSASQALQTEVASRPLARAAKALGCKTGKGQVFHNGRNGRTRNKGQKPRRLRCGMWETLRVHPTTSYTARSPFVWVHPTYMYMHMDMYSRVHETRYYGVILWTVASGALAVDA